MTMVQVTLPDGSRREASAGTTLRQIAEGIGPGLARAALAARVNGEIWDLDRPLESDASVSPLNVVHLDTSGSAASSGFDVLE
jgi:threonyl-tRNA synthetase